MAGGMYAAPTGGAPNLVSCRGGMNLVQAGGRIIVRAPKGRQMISLGREPQGRGKEKKNKPRSGGR